MCVGSTRLARTFDLDKHAGERYELGPSKVSSMKDTARPTARKRSMLKQVARLFIMLIDRLYEHSQRHCNAHIDGARKYACKERMLTISRSACVLVIRTMFSKYSEEKTEVGDCLDNVPSC